MWVHHFDICQHALNSSNTWKRGSNTETMPLDISRRATPIFCTFFGCLRCTLSAHTLTVSHSHTHAPIYTVHNSRAFATPNVGILTQPSSKSFALFDGAAKIKSIKNAQGTVRQGRKVGRRASVAGVTGQGGWPIGVCAREGRCD